MYLQTFIIFAGILKMSIANQPVIFQKDNTIIATEPVKASLPEPHHKFIPVHYPYYEVITNKLVVPATSSKKDSLPADLIEIATTKLGIKNKNEIPSISELGELLGTSSREETIDTIRQLTATDSGIDLIKAFIESSDYTDNTTEKYPIQIEAESSLPSLPTSILSETAQKNLEIIQNVLTTPKPELSFFRRVSAYLNIFDLFPNNKEIPYSPLNKEAQQLEPKTKNSHHGSHHQRISKLQPIPVTNNLPDSFPVPIIPVADNPSTSHTPYRPRAIKESRYFPHHMLQPVLGNHYFN